MQNFDIIIIGSGGGSKITRPAANLGYKVAIIDHGPLGGTCLNRGCIPSKMLIHPADVISEIREAHRFDITVSQDIRVDTQALVTRVNQEIDADSASIAPVYDRHENITLFRETARFVDNKIIQVGNELLTAKLIFIVAGARPNIPTIPGLKGTPYWTSTEALRATKAPKSLIILGAGYIACELGYYYQSLGTKVTFIVRSEFIQNQDFDVVNEFKAGFEPNYTIEKGVKTESVSYDGSLFTLLLDEKGVKREISAEQLLVAAGVVPNSDLLQLEKSGIGTDASGNILVNEYLETSCSSVYAFGDIIGRYLFRHTANFEGEYLFNTVIQKNNIGPINYKPVPYAVFTNPQVAGVGLTEKECIAKGIAYFVGKNNYKNSAMGMALRSENGFVKLIFEKESQKLIGAHIVGKEAATMLHMLIMGMNLGVTLNDLVSMIYIHPALPEIVRNAARKALDNK